MRKQVFRAHPAEERGNPGGRVGVVLVRLLAAILVG